MSDKQPHWLWAHLLAIVVVPSLTFAAAPAPLVSTTEPIATTWVQSVEPKVAALNDPIEIEVENLTVWLAQLPAKADGSKPTAWDVIPFLNGTPLKGVTPEKLTSSANTDVNGKPITSTTIRFRLKRSLESKEVWNTLLNRPVFERPVELSVGVPGQDPIYTNVSKEDFKLTVISKGWLVIGSSIVTGALVIFSLFASRSDLIRDTTAAMRPDGYHPLSLGRAQMAFWFFLVIASYFFLWIVTGDQDTITASTLGLIGISATTALGAAVIDAGKGRVIDDEVVPCLKTKAEYDAEIGRIRVLVGALDAALVQIDTQLNANPAPNAATAMELKAKRNENRVRVDAFKRRIAYLSQQPFYRVATDFLSENGSITFHRFQIFVWTIVLGIIFCVTVYNDLNMPQFSATLLALMGISAGTYIGFKLPPSA
jgi:hypothetical protein